MGGLFQKDKQHGNIRLEFVPIDVKAGNRDNLASQNLPAFTGQLNQNAGSMSTEFQLTKNTISTDVINLFHSFLHKSLGSYDIVAMVLAVYFIAVAHLFYCI